MDMTSDKGGGSWALAGNLWTGRVQDNPHRIDGYDRALGRHCPCDCRGHRERTRFFLGARVFCGGVKTEWARKDKETE